MKSRSEGFITSLEGFTAWPRDEAKLVDCWAGALEKSPVMLSFYFYSEFALLEAGKASLLVGSLKNSFKALLFFRFLLYCFLLFSSSFSDFVKSSYFSRKLSLLSLVKALTGLSLTADLNDSSI
jgi:hypothetical protein